MGGESPDQAPRAEQIETLPLGEDSSASDETRLKTELSENAGASAEEVPILPWCEREAEALEAVYPVRAALYWAATGLLLEFAEGASQRAKEVLVHAATLAPDTRMVHFARRICAERAGDGALAATCLAEEERCTEENDPSFAILRGSLRVRYENSEAVSGDEASFLSLEEAAMHALREGDFEQAAERWKALAASLESSEARASTLLRASTLFRETGKRDDADALITQAASETMAPPVALWIAAGGTSKEPMPTEAVQLRWAEVAFDPRLGRAAWERLGVLHLLKKHFDEAARAFERAAALAPRNVAPCWNLALAHELQGRLEEQAKALDRCATLSAEGARRAEWLRRKAEAQRQLEQLGPAEESLQSALQSSAGYLPALWDSIALATQRNAWPTVAQLTLQSIERMEAPAPRAVQLGMLGVLVEERMHDSSAALALYERALALDPHSEPAQLRAAELHGAQGRWDALRRTLERGIATTTDPIEKTLLQLRLARLFREALAAPALALEVLEQLGPHTTKELLLLEERVSLARSSGQWPAYLQALRALLALQTNNTTRAKLRLTLAMELERRLGRTDEACAELQTALQDDPSLLPARVLLERAGHAVAERAEALPTSKTELAAGQWWRHGIALRNARKLSSAMDAFLQSLQCSPGFPAAFAELERTYYRSEAYAPLCALYETAAAHETQSAHGATRLLAAGELAELALNDRLRAQRNYEQAMMLDGEAEGAILALCALQERTGSTDELLAVLTNAQQVLSHSWTQRLVAARTAFATAVPRLAVHSLEVLQLCWPEGVEATEGIALEGVRAARSIGDEMQEQRWLHALANTATTATLATWAWRRIAQHNERFGATEAAFNAWSQLLENGGDDVEALEGVARTAPATQASIALSHRAQHARDSSSAGLLYFTAGELARRSGALEQARVAFRNAINGLGSFAPVLAWLASPLGDTPPEQAIAAWEHAAEATVLTEFQAATWLQLANTQLEMGHTEAALRAAEKALEAVPEWSVAFALVDRLASQLNAPTRREHAFARHANAIEEPAQRYAVRLQYAEFLQQQKRSNEAVDEWNRATEEFPEDTTAWKLLATAQEQANRPAEAIAAWRAVANSKNATAEEQSSARLSEAKLLLRGLHDPVAARRLLEQEVSAGQTSRVFLSLLAEACIETGDTTALKTLVERLGSEGTPAQRAQAWLDTAGAFTRASLLTEAHQAARKAFELAAADNEALELVVSHHEQTKDWSAFVTRAEEVLETHPSLPLFLCAATVCKDRLQVLDESERHLRKAVERFPRAVAPRISLAKVLEGVNDRKAAAEYRAALQLDPGCVAAWSGLRGICERSGFALAARLLTTAAALFDPATTTPDPAKVPGLRPGLQWPPNEVFATLVGTTRAATTRRLFEMLDRLMLANAEVSAEERAFPKLPESYPAASEVRSVAQVFQGASLQPLRGAAKDGGKILPLATLSFVCGPLHLSPEGTTRLRFEVSRAAAMSAANATSLLTHFQPWLPALVRGLCLPEEERDEEATSLRTQLLDRLTRKQRKELEDLALACGADAAEQVGWWEAEENARGARVGLVFSLDATATTAVLLPALLELPMEQRSAMVLSQEGEALRNALRFATSDACWTALEWVFGQT